MAAAVRQCAAVGSMTQSPSLPGASRAERGFAFGNLVPALVFGVGTYALPLRFWGIDVPMGLLVLFLIATSAVSLYKPEFRLAALRLAALGLLLAGVVLFTLFALSLAFLSGIHGSFGDLGEVLMGLVLALIVPYTLVYPVVELLWLGSRNRALPSVVSAGTDASKSGDPESPPNPVADQREVVE